ncbi:MAG: sulfatase-like hydrolase/transferase, partial [Anaerolineae bacterium]|nr:sulfatase-like hydrolase/transferase [Anaerolineae bacterium]
MKRPNLLFVFVDQMRGQAMGFLNEEPVRTPSLDRFASEGLVLDSVSATYPVCSPYRAMLMTGRYPHANRVFSNCTSKTAPYGVELQEEDRCWSDILKDRGYSLGYIGKWHLDSPREPYIDCYNNRGETKWNEWCPPHRRHGFDFWYSYGTYGFHDRPMYWRTDAARDEFHFVDQWGPEHEADLAIDYLRNEGGTYRNPDKPFGLVVSMNPPHMPYDRVPERYVERYADLSDEQLCTRPDIPPAETKWGAYYRANIRNYFAMITGIDEQFGRILAALEDAGLAEETIVVFTSDH